MPVVKPAPRVHVKTFDFQKLVDAVDRQTTGSAGPKPYPVYRFGSGRNRRVFTEKV